MPRPPKKALEEKAKAQAAAQAQAQAQVQAPIAVPPIAVPSPMPMMAPQPALAGIHQPAVPMQGGIAPRVIDVDFFIRVRDSTMASLENLGQIIRNFSQEYVRQTDLLLGEASTSMTQDPLLTSFDATATQLMVPRTGITTGIAAPVEEKKERKKRTHDPNAPKRPLTPYFLYMQHARSIIANDLGAEAPKGAVQEEGQRRWANMTPSEKMGWNNAYQYNLRLYNAKVHSYKNGNPLAKNMSDEEALKYAEDFHIPMPELKEAAGQQEAVTNDQDAIAEQLQQVVEAPVPTAGEEEEAPTKTPKKATGGRKRKTATPMAEPESAAKPAPSSPDKKRRRTSTKAVEEKDEPKKSGRKKTKSS